MSLLNMPRTVQTCLSFTEHTSEHPLEHFLEPYLERSLKNDAKQTVQIAEMIIDDIKTLTAGYQAALKTGNLQGYSTRIRDMQMNWVNQLQDNHQQEVILEQSNRDLNGQLIQALSKFVNTLNAQQLNLSIFDAENPRALSLMSERESVFHTETLQSEIQLLTHPNQYTLFADDTRH